MVHKFYNRTALTVKAGQPLKCKLFGAKKTIFGLVKNCITAVSLVSRKIFTFENKKLSADLQEETKNFKR